MLRTMWMAHRLGGPSQRFAHWLGHVSAFICHQWNMSYANSSTILQTNIFHMSYGPAMCHTTLPCVVRSTTSASVRTIQSAHLFFAYLSFWIERDISLILHPFGHKQVALNSWWRGLRSRLIWSDSENFEFWAKFDPLDHTSPLESFWTSKRLFSVYLNMRL